MPQADMIRVVTNEEEAFQVLNEVLQGDFDGKVKLKGWPHLHAHLEGDQFHQSITPSVMKGYIELQSSVYKSYAIASYDDADVRHLSKEEKENLELTVRVGDGSAQYEVDLEKVINHIIDKVSSSMTSHDLLILLLGCGLLYTSHAVIKLFLNQRKAVRLKEIDKEDRRETLESIERMSQQETERTKLLTEALTKSPKLRAIEPHAADATAELLRSFSSAKETQIQGVRIEGEAIKELSLNGRRKSEDTEIEGEFRVIRVDSSDPLVLRVKVKDQNTGEIIEAAVEDELMSQRNKAALQAALFARHSVILTITGRIMDEKLKDAVIRRIKDLSQ